MSLADYEDFFYRACLCDQRRPGRGMAARSRTRRGAWRNGCTGKEEIQHRGARAPTCTLNVSGRTFIAADGRHNMPDGEFFTGPGRGLGERRGDVQLSGRLRRAGGRRA